MPHTEPDVLIQRLDAGVPLPSYAHPGDAGADLTIAEDIELGPGERALVRTGLAIALPDGYAAFVHPRSGLAAKVGSTMTAAKRCSACRTASSATTSPRRRAMPLTVRRPPSCRMSATATSR